MHFQRKQNRMPHFDYSSNGIYFVTICTENKKCILGDVINTDFVEGATVQLTETGRLVQNTIGRLPDAFPGINIHNYVVMPNHLHLLIELQNAGTSLSSMMNYLKGYVTHRATGRIWQKSFYDHVIRDEKDYQTIWQYIDNNPGKWSEDRYYTP